MVTGGYPRSFLSCPRVRSRCFAFAVAFFTNGEGRRRRKRRTRRKNLISHPFIRRTTKIVKEIASLVRWVSPISILNSNRKTEWTYLLLSMMQVSRMLVCSQRWVRYRMSWSLLKNRESIEVARRAVRRVRSFHRSEAKKGESLDWRTRRTTCSHGFDWDQPWWRDGSSRWCFGQLG